MGLDEAIVAMNRVSEAGPKDGFWPVVFVGGCNLRCPYCLNAKVAGDPSSFAAIPMDEALRTLDSWQEDGVMVSGGEPLANPDVFELLVGLGRGGRKVGVSTNGSFPEVLSKAIADNLLSFVALDCKFAPVFDVPTLMTKPMILGGDPEYPIGVAKSLWVVREWHKRRQSAQSEVRTTLYPPLVGEEDILAIGGLVHPKSRWVLQQYRKTSGFCGAATPADPYPEAEVERLLAVAKANCEAPVEVRWP